MTPVLKAGDHGTNVGTLQQRLKAAGYLVNQTNVYDEATERAVMGLQRANGLVIDGIYGQKSFMALVGACQPKHLGAQDLQAAADRLGLPLATVRAVNEVESRGQGFLPDGRPVILFERHVFYKRLQEHGVDPAPIALQSPTICAQQVGGYQGGAGEYIRLEIAKHTHIAAAYEAASWGAFQIMGYYWKMLGYASVQDFVYSMQRDEAGQLDAFVRFVEHEAPMLAALKAKKWAAFAKLYNGPAFARNLYDAKLAAAYAKYAELDEVAA
ncbi:DUF3380 domain-containing protein [Massilia dura]|uniref:DUF3380 domain-containing protein n=1 Tax=Pseudoduganella dura TaxID=321982 RepID=A0A6I3X1Y6_9BURK|nr:N-acetylmuramidase family protein [Pseudoduganella dura]MUI10894.1 DUF3380 domain-containing protein [Pseudoduganella dura]GGY12661.1 bacteriophage-acquired protein [Pseudoduganella dura]